ncbi:gamma-glutamyltransferase family protein [Alicyclobacillus sp. ALC3]|uniref:gamma-glutamyltransferase family protein n=1 Tax=Alicyclobacillus sp. ALC3 TaxID=2796143 RepID=UPI00237919D4|nr:gamma-glutamyltransferase family protein [Alicyclobacillus sp. ALC3]WDL95780.1 gamma-glutamyltransferase family protein [Alicyclobacillus sp. ALC3]
MFSGLSFDTLYEPYPSRRSTVFANRGMVATSQPLAAQAGLDILKRGGNAVDAAIATAAALTVVEPTSNGIGGDNFAIVYVADPASAKDPHGGAKLGGASKGRLYGMNSSGPAPALLSRAVLEGRDFTEIPTRGWIPVTVPGIPAGWAALSARFGRLPLKEVLAPAIDYAESGFPISPILGKYWAFACQAYRCTASGSEFEPWFDTFAPDGRAPTAGEVWRSPGHAHTLRAIADSNARDFYEGDLADAIDRFSRRTGGLLRKSDLASFHAEFVDPIHVHYRGFDVWEIPPNGQGLVALLALQILRGFDFTERETTETYHKTIEALKLAFADGHAYIADPKRADVPLDQLLSETYAETRRSLIGTDALQPAPGQLPSGGTVYLTAADADGNLVSFIQSNYMGFGSGLVVPGTGIALQNRGCGFSLDPNHPNALEPGKRPYHTIIPGFLTRGNMPVGPFGVMGGFMQPQGHIQVVMNTVDFHLNPQAALDAPRWQWLSGRSVELEATVPQHIAAALARRGHDVQIARDSGAFGRGEVIWRDPSTGVLAGATEPRTDGSVAAW